MTANPIRFGLQTGQQNVEWSQLVDLWQKADGWGYDSLWNFDHFYPIFVDPDGPCMEGWTTLSALAQVTSRARIGHLVNGNTYRHPSLTAKMAATLDHVSGGRLNLGIGAGWFEREHQDLGFDFKTVRGRLDALDEACRIILGLFTQDRTTVDGKHYQVKDAIGSPKPVQKPHPPLLIGGKGEKVLLRIVARYADMWNVAANPDRMRHLIEVIDRHGETVGRDTKGIEKTVGTLLGYRAAPEVQDFLYQMSAMMTEATPEEARSHVVAGDKQQCIDTIEGYLEVGVTHFIFMLVPPYDMEAIQAFAEDVIPAVRGR